MNIKRINKQGGFTLIELAIVMVIIGILLGVLLKGQTLIDSARGKSVLADMRGMEALVWTYYDRKGRFPGDCDGDGTMGVALGDLIPTVEGSPVGTLDDAEVDPVTDLFSCAAIAAGADGGATIDSMLAELREDKLIPFGVVNSQVSTHAFGGQIRPTNVNDAGAPNVIRNSIIVYDIPLWLGQMIDASIDGEIDGAAGRIRFFGIGGDEVTGLAWPAVTAAAQNVAVSYLFDKEI